MRSRSRVHAAPHRQIREALRSLRSPSFAIASHGAHGVMRVALRRYASVMAMESPAAAATTAANALRGGPPLTDPSSAPVKHATGGSGSHDNHNANTHTDSSTHHGAPRELCFFSSFVEADVDLHWELLVEAHRKHGVWLSVPPQAPPKVPHVGPPTIPEVILPPRQCARMAAIQPAYPPTHDPPPLRTTGHRALQVGEAYAATGTAGASPLAQLQDLPEHERALREQFHRWGAADATPMAASRTSGASQVATSPPLVELHQDKAASGVKHGKTGTAPSIETVVTRAPVDPSMKFHCSLCGKAFRKAANATAHVDLMHNSAGSGNQVAGQPHHGSVVARVLQGPGPGEVMGSEDVVVFASPNPASQPSLAGGTSSDREKAETSPQEKDARTPSNDLGSISNISHGSKGKSEEGTPAVRLQPITTSPYDVATVTLPEEELIDKLLLSVWDAVALGREDIAKPANLPIDPQNPRQLLAGSEMLSATGTTGEEAGGAWEGERRSSGSTRPPPPRQQQWDSMKGAFFIPAALVVEGTADRRKELEALHASKPLARATPEGAAPGIKRRASHTAAGTAGRNPSAAAAAAVAAGVRKGLVSVTGSGEARWLPIRELNKQYPNPFGNSSNAAAFLVELEREPVNPFVDLEGEQRKKDGQGDSKGASGDADVAATGAAGVETAGTASTLSSAPATTPSAATAKTTHEKETQRGRHPADNEETRHLLSVLVARPFPCPLCMRQHRAARERATHEGGTLLPVNAFAEWVQASAPYRFRLLDSLLDHIDAAHQGNGTHVGAEAAITEEEVNHLYAVEANPVVAVKEELRSLWSEYQAYTASMAASARDHGGGEGRGGSSSSSSSGGGDGHGDSGDDGGDKKRGLGLGKNGADGEAGVSSSSHKDAFREKDASDDSLSSSMPLVPKERVHVHARCGVNTVLVGVVRDIQEGYLGDTPILQYVVGVLNPAPSSRGTAAAADFRTTTHASDGGEETGVVEEGKNEEEEEEELVVVRCVSGMPLSAAASHGGNSSLPAAELLPRSLLRQRIHLGSRVFVEGSLRMNRRVDAVSKRSHAYPYVQVAPPLGSIHAL